MLAGFAAIVTVGGGSPAVRLAQKPNWAEAAGASSRFQHTPVKRTVPPAALATAFHTSRIVPGTAMSVAHTTRAGIVFVTVAFTQNPTPQSLDVWVCAGNSDTAGATTTVMVTERAVVPPGPLQVSVYVQAPAAVEATPCLPLSGRAPSQPPVAVHAVAFVVDHLSV